MRLNIVICTYNAAFHLRGCLASVVDQVDAQVRVWIFDGASTDGTLQIAGEFKAHLHQIHSAPDKGVYDAMNRAAQMVSDGWILFLGADDRLMPKAIQRFRDAVPTASAGSGVIYGDVYRPEANAVYDGPFNKWKLVRRNICQQAILYDSKILKKHPFDLRFRINADHVLNLDLMLSGVSFTYVPVCLAYYEDITEGISRDRADEDFVPFRRRLIKQRGDWPLYVFTCLIDFKQRIRLALKRWAAE